MKLKLLRNNLFHFILVLGNRLIHPNKTKINSALLKHFSFLPMFAMVVLRLNYAKHAFNFLPQIN